jgi:hypothetical protein
LKQFHRIALANSVKVIQGRKDGSAAIETDNFCVKRSLISTMDPNQRSNRDRQAINHYRGASNAAHVSGDSIWHDTL